MPTVRALFCRSNHISTPLLRAAMWSQWSHVAPIIDDEPDCVIDATFLAGGVRRRSLSALVAKATMYEIREFACPYPLDAFDWARKQIGRPYDAWGVLGIGLHRDWWRADAWFCSEFFEAVLRAGGGCRFIERNVHRVTVEHSYMVR